MKEAVKIFNNAQFGQIRTAVGASGEPLFCLADVCKALGLEQPHRVKPRLQQGGVTTITVGVQTGTKINGTPAIQQVEMNFINEPNLYKCIFKSRKAEAEQFQDWVCGEVLPAIREQGGYMTARPDESPEQIMARALVIAQNTLTQTQSMLAKSETKIELLRGQCTALCEENTRLTEQAEKSQGAVNFANAVASSNTSILIGELAKILHQNGIDIGQNRLFQWMRDNGWLIKAYNAMHNQPTQRAMDAGFFEVKKTMIVKPNGESICTSMPKVTCRGQMFFVNHFLYEKEQGRIPALPNKESNKKGGEQ